MDIKNKIIEDTFLKEKDIIIPNGNLVSYDLPTSTYIDSRLLEDSRVVASYKMYWLLGILEEVNLGNKEINFKKLISRMIVGSWYPIMQYKLYFGQFDNLSKVVEYISSVYNKHSSINSNELLDFIYNSNDKILNKQMKELSYKVPYMLLSPFFDDKIKGLKSSRRVKRIIELSLSEPNVLYKIIIDKENKVVIDDEWARYMTANYRIIKSWIYYKLSCFLQKRNPNVPSIIFKLDPPKSRDLSHATKLWTDIINNRHVFYKYKGREGFNEKLRTSIAPIYQIAVNQGFSVIDSIKE